MQQNFQQPPPQLNLPFTPFEPMVQPRQYSLDSPPATPSGIDTVPGLQSAIVPIAAMAANEISGKIQMHNGRMFLFNQCSQNNWNSQQFAFVINTALNLLMVGMYNRQYQNPENGGRQCVEQAVAMASALNCTMFPDLLKVINPAVHPDIGENINRYQVIQQAFPGIRQYYMQAAQQGNFMPQAPVQQQFGSSGQGPGGFPAAYGNVTAGTSWSQGQAQHRANFGPVAGAGYFPPGGNQGGSGPAPGLFNNSGQMGNSGEIPMATGGSRYAAYTEKTQLQIAESVIDQGKVFGHRQQAVVEQQVVDVPVKRIQKDWTPNKAQQYKPAYNSLTQKLMLGTVTWADGSEFPIYTVVELNEEEKMERTAHEIGSVDRTLTSTAPEAPARPEALRNAVDETVRRGTEVREFEKNVGKVPEEDRPAQFKSESPPDAFSTMHLQSMIFEAKVWRKRFTQSSPSEISSLICNGIVGRPVITDADFRENLTNLANLNRFDSIVRWITLHLENSITAQLAAEVDKILTKAINSILHNELSVAMSISSFADDGVALIAHLDSEYGPNFKKAYLGCQENLTTTNIASYLLDDPDIDSRLKSYMDQEIFDAGVVLTFIPKYVQFVLLGVRSAELGVVFEADKVVPSITLAQQLTEADNYSLFCLAKEMFGRADNDSQSTAHCLLVTEDNEIYEFHRGLIGIECYTISKFVE